MHQYFDNGDIEAKLYAAMNSAKVSFAELSGRLRVARSSANLTQDVAAVELGLGRTTLVAIEKGQRPVRPDELLALARLYGVSAGKLTSPDAVHVDLAAKFRRTQGKDASRIATEALALLNRLATGVVQLERLLGRELRTDYPPPIRIDPRFAIQQAEDAANNLRARLGTGLGPIPDPINLLEVEVGLRIFFRPLASQISGLYAHRACGARDRLYVHPAARGRPSVHDRHGNQNALYRPRLAM